MEEVDNIFLVTLRQIGVYVEREGEREREEKRGDDRGRGRGRERETN